MQPPRTRTPRLELGDTETIRSIILNVTAAWVTLLLLRIASLLVVDADEGPTITRYIQFVTEPLVWPFKFVPLMSSNVVKHVTVIDVLMVFAVAVTGLMVAGILAGWRDSQSAPRRYDTREE